MSANLAAIAAGIPISRGQRVLSLGGFDEAFSAQLATRALRRDVIVEHLASEPDDELEAFALPYSSSTFGVVACDMPWQEIVAHPGRIAEIARVLKPGGLVVIVAFRHVVSVQCSWPATVAHAMRQLASPGKDSELLDCLAALLRDADLAASALTDLRVTTKDPMSESSRVHLRRGLQQLTAHMSQRLCAEQRSFLWPYLSMDAIEGLVGHRKTVAEMAYAVVEARKSTATNRNACGESPHQGAPR